MARRRSRLSNLKRTTVQYKPNNCPAAKCWKCGKRIRMGNKCVEHTTRTSEFRGDDEVAWTCKDCAWDIVGEHMGKGA